MKKNEELIYVVGTAMIIALGIIIGILLIRVAL